MTLAIADISATVLPHWRWQEAERICDDPTGARSTDDPVIQAAATYLLSDDASRFPLIEAARKIFESDGVLRAEIEARILAGQDDAEIAEKCNIPPELVAVYESLFFFVRRYLHAEDWLMSKVVGFAHLRGFQNHEVRQFWSWAATAGGPVVVDCLIWAMRDTIRSGGKATLATYLRDNAAASPKLQGFVAINAIPADEGNQWLLEFGNQVLEAQESPSKEQALSVLRSETIRCARTYLQTGRMPDPPTRNPLRAMRGKQSRALVANMFKSLRDPQGSPETHGRTTARTDRHDESPTCGEPRQAAASQTDHPAASCDGQGR